MTKYLSLLILCLLTLQLAAQTDPDREAEAEADLDYYSGDKPSQERSDRFSDNLWFGGGIQLGFQANTFNSFFLIGLSPMVGYKLNDRFSVGPRVSLNYNRFTCDQGDFKTGYLTWEAGIFARAKIINPIFIHAEMSLENRRLITGCNEPLRQTRSVPYLGVGYSPDNGGGGSSELLLLFRLRRDGQNIIESPYVFRTGFNFNF
jgi:hypothetical protein